MIDHVTARELERLLDAAPAGVRVVSLDCFDTLIWRNCLRLAGPDEREQGGLNPVQVNRP